MSLSVPLDRLVSNILSVPVSRINELRHELTRRFYPALFTTTSTTPGNGKNNEELPRLIKTSWGEEYGYIIDMSSFPRHLFSDAELALIDYSDRRSKEIHYGVSGRRMGGVFERHPLDMIDLHYKIARQVAEQIVSMGILPPDRSLSHVLDYRGVISKRRHDDYEDPKTLKKDSYRFKELTRKLNMTKPDYKEMRDLQQSIKREREKIINTEFDKQNEFIEATANRLNLDERTKQAYILGGAIAIGVDDWLTRHIEEQSFTGSMYRMSRRYNVGEYNPNEHIVRGGPFQPQLIALLGLSDKDVMEPAEYFLMRLYDKTLDRISLSMERAPRYRQKPRKFVGIPFLNPDYDWSRAAELKSLFRDQQLRSIYGENVSFRAADMPRTDVLDMLYRNAVVLHNIDDALVSHGGGIAKQKKQNPAAFVYLLAILKAREYLKQESEKIIAELRVSYESDLGPKESKKEQKDIDEIAKTNPEEYREITGQGPITHGFRYETGRLENREKKDDQVLTNYRDVLGFEKLIQNFEIPQQNKVDLDRGVIRLFRIKGLGYGISFRENPRPF